VARPRLIPVLLLKHGVLVRSQAFRTHQVIGNPMSTVERFSNWNVDELILLDIGADDFHDLRRDDIQQRYQGTSAVDVLREVAKVCFMPLSFGGRIRTLEDIHERLAAGADKVVVNTAALDNPSFIEAASRRYGAQCIVVSIDALHHGKGRYEVYAASGRRPTGLNPVDWAREAARRGAGEIFLNSIDRDGAATGYDLRLTRSTARAVDIPVITCGGVGSYEDFASGVSEGGASAVAAANIFHFFEHSYPRAKQTCIDAGIPMRPVRLDSRWQRREPDYDRGAEDARLAGRIRRAQTADFTAAKPCASRNAIRWCTRCVYPSISAAPMEFDEHGVCMGCRMADVKARIAPSEWQRRHELLKGIFEKYRCRDGSRHDVVIAVSGGKDSWYQTHVIKEVFGLNPLLVTYDGNNWTDVGWRNMVRMREVFGCDHVVVRPAVETLKKLNRLAFKIMGDMNWHAHVGITTAPVQVAIEKNVPLVIWGEHGYLDLSGQFSMYDFPEMSYRDRLEHFARGYEWNFFVGREGLTSQDMATWKYPSDRNIFDVDLRGIYLGNYVYWEANEHSKMVVECYGFETSDVPFERTYRRMSNLDDMHENGVHDYLKYIKFGYGRCTDHACKDIRAGLLTREQALERVRQMDHVKSSDLNRWLDYVGMTEDEFDRIADTFRDPRVWRMVEGRWVKDAPWADVNESRAKASA
jgi:imidazoleglycerol phosphate synthase cyclase subunit